MEFGSVKFFKVLILSTLAALVLILSVSAVLLGIGFSRRGQTVDRLSDELENLSNELLSQQLSNDQLLASKQTEQMDLLQGKTPDYQSLYPDMMVEAPTEYRDTPKTAYLTFDDGPSANTAKNLDVLKEKQVKATFFVTGENSEANPALLKRIVEEGHTLGIHTYSHKYNEIYASVEAYLEDFYKMWSFVLETTGEKATVFRFPGGSINAYNRGIYQEIVAEMTRRGFTYYDWNVSSGDAANNVTAQGILHGVVDYVPRYDMAIVLMHDRADNTKTQSMLPQIIDSVAAAGYEFGRLSNDIRPITFAYSY